MDVQVWCMIVSFLPNIISFLRCGIASGLFVGAFFSSYFSEWYLPLFCIGYVSDALDGMLARYFSVSSAFGAWLDLLADKMLFFAIWLHIGLSYQNHIIFWAVVLLALREVISIVLRHIATKHNTVLHVKAHGKIKTIFLGIVCVYTLMQDHAASDSVLLVMWALAVFMSYLSLWMYVQHIFFISFPRNQYKV